MSLLNVLQRKTLTLVVNHPQPRKKAGMVGEKDVNETGTIRQQKIEAVDSSSARQTTTAAVDGRQPLSRRP